MLYECVVEFVEKYGAESPKSDKDEMVSEKVCLRKTLQEEEEIAEDAADKKMTEKLAANNLSSEETATLWKKLYDFLVLLNRMRDKAVYTPVHQLILKILDETGYGNYAKALPNGAQRSANLAMLVEKAMDYEKTSYRGLFNFVRYIEHLRKYEVDYGEVNLSGAGEGSVEIMTIHKSKGLDFQS